ncbi:MAG: metallophosphoesterase, partial [Clostridiales Family XIII bacterium]|nr:metallophosphoesterase [Clostridiales Family XIII bacterium]
MNDFLHLTFKTNWGFVFFAVLLLNIFIFLNYFYIIKKYKIHVKKRKNLTILIIGIHIILAGTTIFYFVKNFSGKSSGEVLSVIKYIAGFCNSFFILIGIAFFLIDIYILVRIVIIKLRKRQKKNYFPFKFTIFIIIISFALSLLSFIAPRNIVLTKYDISLPKKNSSLTSLKIIFISDFHLGSSVEEKELKEIKTKVNKEKPDIVFFGGDIFDEGSTENQKNAFTKEIGHIKSTYGTYYIIGNHDDYYGRHDLYDAYKKGEITLKTFQKKLVESKEVLSNFKKSNIIPLINKVKNVENKFYIIGRDDAVFDKEKFLTFENQIKKNLPVIVIDHQPRVNETEKSKKVDLQISGHTHNGQLIPFSLLDPFKLKNNYGEYKRGNIILIVSSGVG